MSRTEGFQSNPDPLFSRVWGELCERGLERQIAELDAQGFTVIEPDVACPDGLGERLLEACLQVAERRNGLRPDVKSLRAYSPASSDRFKGVLGSDDGDSPIGDLMQSMLFEDSAFEVALMNPVLLAIATYMCGYSSVLYTMGCFMKGANRTPLALHADTKGPSPLPALSVECNLTYALTDFNRENGATAFVPGSHKLCRQPMGDETRVLDNPNVVPIECAAGSLICWHGNTWHGAFNRTAPGLRVSLPIIIARPHLRTQEYLIDNIPRDMLARNSARFAVLTQQGITDGWASQDQCIAGVARAARYQSAYYEELGLDLSQHAHSHFS